MRRLSCLSAICAVAITLAAPLPVQAQISFDDLVARFMGRKDEGVAKSNGRIEAQTVSVATKYDGRVAEVLVREGDLVEAGAVVARMDDRDVQAQIVAAKASVLRARASRQIAEAAVMQAESAMTVADTNWGRVKKLNEDGHAADSVLDDATNALNVAKASVATAHAQVSDADALIAVSEAQEQQLDIALDDLTIRAPLRGRVLYRLREPGEVIAAGAPIVSVLDLTDVYMNIYLPATTVGQLVQNDEARVILDPIRQFVIPARVTFISPDAQFTPKSVETQSEREDLVFRVKLSIPRELLAKFEEHIKVGVRGIGFVRTSAEVQWPADLQVKLPE